MESAEFTRRQKEIQADYSRELEDARAALDAAQSAAKVALDTAVKDYEAKRLRAVEAERQAMMGLLDEHRQEDRKTASAVDVPWPKGIVGRPRAKNATGRPSGRGAGKRAMDQKTRSGAPAN